MVKVESQLDFSDEEDVAGVDKEQISGEVGLLRNKMDFLIKNFSPYKKGQEKKRVVLTGRLMLASLLCLMPCLVKRLLLSQNTQEQQEML